MSTKAALFLSSAFVAVCLAPGTQDPKPAAATAFVLDAGEIKLEELIDKCAAYLQRNIMSSKQELMNTLIGGESFSVQKRIEVDHDGCEELLTAMLFMKGFVLTELDEKKGVYEVISMNGPRHREITGRAVPKKLEQVLSRPNLRVPVTTAVHLKHVNPMVATNALRPFIAKTGAPGVTLGLVGSNSAILLTGLQDQVANAIRVLQEADVPGTPAAPGVAERLDQLTQRVTALEEKVGKGK